MACHPAGPEIKGGLAPEKLPPPERLEGIGNGHLEITSANPEAKLWFDQGLNLLHDFWDYESERAFAQSVRLDPQCAMCWWGLAQAESFRGGNTPYATDALKHATKLAKHVGPAEKLYLRAALDEDKQSRHRDKSKPGKTEPEKLQHVDSRATHVYRELVAKFPSDTQARIFLAESLMDGFDRKGEPRAGTREGQGILLALIKEHPDDSAANHYWIHAVEPGNHPELALESARKLGALTPASGHMVHMPGHIFYRTGDYETARASFQASMRVDEGYMRAQGVSVDDDWNYVHNMMYLIADLLEEGRIAEATATSAKLNEARGQTPATLYLQTPRDGLTRLDVALPVFLRGAEWERASTMLAAGEPAPELKNLASLRDWLLLYTRGMAALEKGDVKEAGTKSDELENTLLAAPGAAAMAMGHPMPGTPPMSPVSKDALARPVHSYLDVASMELAASVLMAQGKTEAADAKFSKAADAEVALGYREPPFYIRPVAEARGDALMRARRFPEAKAAYEQGLHDRPNSGYPLFGIARAEACLKNTAAATAAYARMLAAWDHADPDLPQVVSARAWMTAHTAPANGAE